MDSNVAIDVKRLSNPIDPHSFIVSWGNPVSNNTNPLTCRAEMVLLCTQRRKNIFPIHRREDLHRAFKAQADEDEHAMDS